MSAGSADTNDHAAFFLKVMSHFENGRVDWDAVAVDIGISYGRNASAKFAKLIKTYGYEWKDGKVTPLAGSSDSSPTPTPTTPVKTKKAAGAARKEPGSSGKKRKVAAVEDEQD